MIYKYKGRWLKITIKDCPDKQNNNVTLHGSLNLIFGMIEDKIDSNNYDHLERPGQRMAAIINDMFIIAAFAEEKNGDIT